MDKMGDEWERAKRAAWIRMLEDLEIGYLDTDILEILVELFARPKSFPKSSCSGRITLIDADYPWVKGETSTIFKSHAPISVEDVERVLKAPYTSRLWLSVQGPIYHVYVADLDEARELLNAAREAGFKHSGIMVLGRGMHLVEVRTGVRADILVADPGGLLLPRAELERAVEVANDVLAQAKERNRRLLESLRRRRPKQAWSTALEFLRELSERRWRL
ncbi:MAG: hypothetical protein ABWW70_03570 [Thermoproteota archaeon]